MCANLAEEVLLSLGTASLPTRTRHHQAAPGSVARRANGACSSRGAEHGAGGGIRRGECAEHSEAFSCPSRSGEGVSDDLEVSTMSCFSVKVAGRALKSSGNPTLLSSDRPDGTALRFMGSARKSLLEGGIGDIPFKRNR